MPIYRWYKNFQVGSITSYDVFEEKFLQEWGVKYDRKYLMNQLYEIKKKDNGIVQLEFNQIFESVLEKTCNQPNAEPGSYYIIKKLRVTNI